MRWFVYILYSPSLKVFYKGHTSNLKGRIVYHNSGFEDYTSKGSPWELCWSAEKETKSQAFQLELKLKNLTKTRLIEFMRKYEDGLTSACREILEGFEP